MAGSSYWLPAKPLILASSSMSRSNLLAAAGLPHDVMPAQIDERAVEQSLAHKDGPAIAAALAIAKAIAVAAQNPGRIVLGADQTLSLDEMLLHKPGTLEDARHQLLRMRGRAHRLHSAVAVVKHNEILFRETATAQIALRDFSERFLDDYLDAAGPAILSSVGCYHVEGHGVHLFDAIDGDQFTIMGLPILPLLNYFRQAGYIGT